MNRNLVIGLILAVTIIIGLLSWSKGQKAGEKIEHKTDTAKMEKAEYNPAINPSDFVSKIDNKYFTLNPGTKFTYQENTRDGLEKSELVVTHKTKIVAGVTTTVVQDTAWIDGKLKEDTTDLYAQDKAGNVWYL